MSPCLQTAVKDFVDTLNENSGCLTEFAFANPGTSNFNRAIYCEQPSESKLLAFAQSEANVSFATGLCRERFDSIDLETQISRQGADRHVRLKQILSFDVDFKSNSPNYDNRRTVFYDFSTSRRGDMFSLIGELANLDTKNEFPKILKIAAKIAGEEQEEPTGNGFHINDKGVWYQSANDADPKWLSSPVFVEALTRNALSSLRWQLPRSVGLTRAMARTSDML